MPTSRDKNEIAVEVFDKHAQAYAAKFMDVSAYGPALERLCALLPAGAQVLELACGPGNVTRYLLDRRPDLVLLATDLAPQMLALAQAHNPTAEVQLLDGRAMRSLDRAFDAIVCGFLLPYLSREEAIALIHDAAETLLPDGFLFLSTMEDDYANSGWRKGSQGDEIFMHFHEAGYLVSAMEAAGMRLVDLERVVTTMSDGTKVTDLLLLCQKSQA